MALSPALNPHSAVPPGKNGFTLVELMVVIFIIGLASGAVVLAMAPPGSGTLEEAERFAARAAAARDLAIIERRPVRLWVSGSGYGFEQRGEGQWVPADNPLLETRDWPDGVAVSMTGGDQARRTFSSTGLPDAPLALALARKDAHAAVHIEGSGKVRVDAR